MCNEQNVHTYYMLNQRIRRLLFHYYGRKQDKVWNIFSGHFVAPLCVRTFFPALECNNVFCTFSCPNMVRWPNSGIISNKYI